jgi:hypothetical protein
MTQPDLGAALDALLDAACRRAGVSRPPELAAWRDVARLGGPTSRSGPLTHDVVLPHTSGERGLGLNLFRHPETDSVELAHSFAAERLGATAASALDALLHDPPPGLEIQPGIHLSAAGPKLKLYFGSNRPDALPQLAGRIGLETAPESRGLAIDLDATGLSRPRQYRKLERAAPELGAYGGDAARWSSMACVGTSFRHCMLGSLGRWPEPSAKRALVQTFAPDASLDALIAYESDLIAAGVALPRPCDASWLEDLARVVAGTGHALCAVAHELDLFPDGRIDSDVFVTIGARER